MLSTSISNIRRLKPIEECGTVLEVHTASSIIWVSVRSISRLPVEQREEVVRHLVMRISDASCNLDGKRNRDQSTAASPILPST
jgi:hypothetical protein